ncbi:ATP-binding protein [Saccharibacillus sacchari]|uniref:ATP-binding protein n=1 Tax=Saccharibacillus sacchari TaxID=456493 RepID=A0ACC6P975_9BACL
MELFKLFIIQVLFAVLPILLLTPFETFFRRFVSKPLSASKSDYVVQAFTAACAVSVLLCWLLDLGSARIDGQLALLPAAVGILYGLPRVGLFLAALYGLSGFLFVGTDQADYLWIETLALLPLVVARARLLRLSRPLRIVLLAVWMCGAYTPHLIVHIQEHAGVSAWPLVVVELLAALLSGALLLLSRRAATDRFLREEQAGLMREKVVEEETKLQAFMRTLPGFALALDRSRLITAINDQAFAALQKKSPSIGREAVVGKTFEELLMSIGLAPDPVFLQALDTATEQNCTVERTLSFGSRRFRFHASPTHTGKGEVIGTVCSIYEITEIERMRTELEHMNRLSMIGQMAASVTHEVRNPMAVVRGYLQLLQKKTPADYDHYYEVVLQELDRATGIIDDFLSLARTQPDLSETRSLSLVVKELMPLLQADANLRGQTLRLETDGTTEAMPMHSGEIKQLVLNLSRNAMEAMDDQGELVVRVEESEDSFRLRVTDNGPGIPEEKIEQVRQPFFTTKERGTGLGLPLCAGIAERHGGKLTIESEPGKGTEVTVEFART